MPASEYVSMCASYGAYMSPFVIFCSMYSSQCVCIQVCGEGGGGGGGGGGGVSRHVSTPGRRVKTCVNTRC